MKGITLCGRVLTTHSWKCSWSLIATVGSVVVLVSVVHMFFTPLFPSGLDYFGARRAQNQCLSANLSSGADLDGNSQLGIDFDKQFLADSLGAVRYHNAPWKAEIGRWLSGCDAVSTSIDVLEVCIHPLMKNVLRENYSFLSFKLMFLHLSF